MLRIGCHVSSSKGYASMGKDAVFADANTFQFFTRNPRGGKAKKIDEADVEAFLALASEKDIAPFIAHAPYTLNACSADKKIRAFALEIFKDDLSRMEHTPGNFYNFHPGSHVGQGLETGINYIAEMLNSSLSADQTTTVLLETMSGKGSEIGGKFEELREIIDRVELQDKVGVCLDTCHIWDAGYDIVSNIDEVLTEFDDIIGLNRLKAIHLNDSLNDLGTKKDRHTKIGEGKIGLEGIVRIINHDKLKKLPFCLETPCDLQGYAQEIALLRSMYKG